MTQLILNICIGATLLMTMACTTSKDTANKQTESDTDESTTVEKPSEIQFFHGTMAEAKAKAKKEGKKIFFDAYTVWCGPCKMMANRTFTQQEVADFFNENFINVKMDMERGEGVGLASKYEIKAYPTLLILDANGDVVDRTLGYQQADELIAFGERNVQ